MGAISHSTLERRYEIAQGQVRELKRQMACLRGLQDEVVHLRARVASLSTALAARETELRRLHTWQENATRERLERSAF